MPVSQTALIDPVVGDSGATYHSKFISLFDRVGELQALTSGVALNAREYGAVGDGVADDTSTLQTAITAAANRTLYIPAGTYLVSSALTYNVATSGPIRIVGDGPGTILKASGTNNKVLYITGTADATTVSCFISDLQIQSNTSGVSAAGIHLSGLAVFGLHDVIVNGSSKMTNGIQCTGTQQGEISGGQIAGVAIGIQLEDTGGVGSNGVDIHGVSMSASGACIVVDGADTAFIHGNHLVSQVVCVDVVAAAAGGMIIVASNHMELHVTAGVRVASTQALIHGNAFFPGANGVDILVSSGAGTVIDSNLLQGDVTLVAGVTYASIVNNFMLAGCTVTDGATSTIKYGNRGAGGGSALNTLALTNDLVLTSPSGTAGNILALNANALISGSWGMSVTGAGVAQDVYLKLQDVVLAGNTSGAVLKVLSGVGGSEWARFNSTKLLLGGGLGVGNSAAATTLGSVVKKMQLFDTSGNSLGYVPIYDAIT